MLDESAMQMLEELQKTIKDAVSKKDGGAQGELTVDDEAGGVSERRSSSRESKQPVDSTSWRSNTWANVVSKMNAVRVLHQVKRQRTEVKDGELEIVMRTLMTGSADDVQRLRELDILNDSLDLDAVEVRQLSREQWREATNYKTPRGAKDAYAREPDEAAAWKEAIEGELDWFIENGPVLISHKDEKVPAKEIPPYKWNADMLQKLRLVDFSRLAGLKKKQDRVRESGGKIDECFDIL
jgi:hypothetical protein